MQSIYIYIISLTILIGSALLILISLKLTEHFEVSTSSKEENTINGFITITSESLCPALLFMLNDTISELGIQGSEEEKHRKGMAVLEADAGGPLFPCPPPSDPVNVPANINSRIKRTILYLYRKVKRARDKIQGAMNCEKQSESDLDDQKKKEEKEDKAARRQRIEDPLGSLPSADQYPQPISQKDRATILKLRANTLAQSLKNQTIVNQLVSVKTMTDGLLATKKAAEENKIRPTCTKSGESESDQVEFN